MSFSDPPVQKKSKLPLILGLLGGGVLLCVACCGGCTYFGYQQVKAPIDASVAEMTLSPAISEKLGTPIESSLNGVGLRKYTNNNGNGDADFSFNATGPDGSARVSVQLTLTASKWRVETLKAECDDGSTVTITAGTEVEQVTGTESDADSADSGEPVDGSEDEQ